MENQDFVAFELDEPVESSVEFDKKEKFKSTSLDLVRKAIIAIEKLEKCSNKKNYEYSEEEVEIMFAAMEEALADTKAKFKTRKEFSWN